MIETCRNASRTLSIALCSLALAASLAFADPAVQVSYMQGVPQVELEGSYPQCRYAV